ncbi:MAG: nitroreductase family protein [Candidatus Binataceae bacterium]
MSELGIFETIYSARAMRRFKPDPVPDAIISRILDAAIRAPSAGNTQDWLFVVITDPAQRHKVGEIYRRASMWVRTIYENNPPPAHMNPGQYERFWSSGTYLHEHMADAPVLLVPCLRLRQRNLPPAVARAAMEREFSWRAGASIYPAVQNIILACRALGLGTVLTTNHMLLEDEMKEALGLDPEVMTFGLMPVGYPVGKFGPVVRKPIAEVVIRDRFPQPWKE